MTCESPHATPVKQVIQGYTSCYCAKLGRWGEYAQEWRLSTYWRKFIMSLLITYVETLPKDIIIRSLSSEPFRSLLLMLGYYFHKLLIRWKSNHKIDKTFSMVNFYFPKRSASLWTIRWNVNHDANSASMESKKWAHDTKKRCESAGGSDASEISLA